MIIILTAAALMAAGLIIMKSTEGLVFKTLAGVLLLVAALSGIFLPRFEEAVGRFIFG